MDPDVLNISIDVLFGWIEAMRYFLRSEGRRSLGFGVITFEKGIYVDLSKSVFDLDHLEFTRWVFFWSW